MSVQMEENVEPQAPTWRFNLGGVMFLASFFVLGGNFWEKIRAPFIRDSRVVYPANPAA